MGTRIFIKLLKIFQGDSQNNRMLLEVMKENGVTMAKIRKVLGEINDINIPELANGKVAVPTMYNTIRGMSDNDQAKELWAGALGLNVNELFPANN